MMVCTKSRGTLIEAPHFVHQCPRYRHQVYGGKRCIHINHDRDHMANCDTTAPVPEYLDASRLPTTAPKEQLVRRRRPIVLQNFSRAHSEIRLAGRTKD
jgi:hypothetical protein